MVGILSFRKKGGAFRTSWFEDDSVLEEESPFDLLLTRSVAANWPAFRFTSKKPTPVLFNPSAVAFSEEVRDTVGEIEGVEIERLGSSRSGDLQRVDGAGGGGLSLTARQGVVSGA